MNATFLNLFDQTLPKLGVEERLSLIKRIWQSFKSTRSSKLAKKKVGFKDIRGKGKGIWGIDAQEYVNSIRVDRF